MYFIYTCRINLHIRENGDYKKTEMERTVGRAFESWERLKTLCDETNLVWLTEIESPSFLNLKTLPSWLKIYNASTYNRTNNHLISTVSIYYNISYRFYVGF